MVSLTRPQSLTYDERLAALQHVGGLYSGWSSNSAAVGEIHQMTDLSLMPEKVVPSPLNTN